MRLEGTRMPDLEDGETIEVQGSGSNRYTIRNAGEAYSCTCPAWRNQSITIERRTCKHIKGLRGEAAELARIGAPVAIAGAGKSAAGASGQPAQPAQAKADQGGPPILLANPWDNAQDLSGWWISEKLDGVRAYWDGKVMLSRLGNRYHAPDWFTKDLPPFPLDGELWGGRKKFQRTVSVVRRQDQSEQWKSIAYVVFDAPSHDGVFEDRQEILRRTLEERSAPYARFHDQQRCKDLTHLREELRRVEALGGEGLMLRKPGSRYEVGRSPTLLKVKSFFDAEAIVVGHLPGTGRHAGRLGALLVELADGTRFSVGTGLSDREREAPPKVGAVVTFRYQELSDGGVPRFPSYVGVRDDVKWPPDNALKGKTAERGTSATPSAAAGASTGKAHADEASPPKAAAHPAPAVESAKPAVAPVAAPARGEPRGGARRFERTHEGARSFWEIDVHGSQIAVREGRSWATGTSITKELGSANEAQIEAQKLIADKLREGYVEA
jgi:DNA ligase-1